MHGGKPVRAKRVSRRGGPDAWLDRGEEEASRQASRGSDEGSQAVKGPPMHGGKLSAL